MSCFTSGTGFSTLHVQFYIPCLRPQLFPFAGLLGSSSISPEKTVPPSNRSPQTGPSIEPHAKSMFYRSSFITLRRLSRVSSSPATRASNLGTASGDARCSCDEVLPGLNMVMDKGSLAVWRIRDARSRIRLTHVARGRRSTVRGGWSCSQSTWSVYLPRLLIAGCLGRCACRHVDGLASFQLYRLWMSGQSLARL
jgi:hypothetical protein